jgi:hypothetical protein
MEILEPFWSILDISISGSFFKSLNLPNFPVWFKKLPKIWIDDLKRSSIHVRGRHKYTNINYIAIKVVFNDIRSIHMHN